MSETYKRRYARLAARSTGGAHFAVIKPTGEAARLKRSNWQVLAEYIGASRVAPQVVDLLKEHMAPGLQCSGRHALPKLRTRVETTP